MTFLGFIQYLKKFMPNMADISAPLRKLTEKDVEWKWTETEENSSNKLKKLATEAPVLRFYDPTLPLTLSVDSSSTGLGCVIMQEGQPIAYASRALTNTQQNYAQIEKRDTGSCVRVRKVPSVCVWSNCRGRNRPQTPAVNLQQTATSSASETPTLSAATTEV